MSEIKNNEQTLKVRREYYKKWRSNNKDKIKEYNKRYWEKKTLKNKEN